MTILGKKQMSEEDIKLNYITPVIRIGNSFRVPKEPFYEWMKSSHTIMN